MTSKTIPPESVRGEPCTDTKVCTMHNLHCTFPNCTWGKATTKPRTIPPEDERANVELFDALDDVPLAHPHTTESLLERIRGKSPEYALSYVKAAVEFSCMQKIRELQSHRQREEIGRLREALDRYRYATQWTAADAWDFCSDCQERIQWAHAHDTERLSVNEVAAIGKMFLACSSLSDTTREK